MRSSDACERKAWRRPTTATTTGPGDPGRMSGVSGILSEPIQSGESITMDVGVGSTATLPIVPEPGAVASIGPFLAALHLLGRRRPPFR